MKRNYAYLSLFTLFLFVIGSNTVLALQPTADPWIMHRHDNALVCPETGLKWF